MKGVGNVTYGYGNDLRCHSWTEGALRRGGGGSGNAWPVEHRSCTSRVTVLGNAYGCTDCFWRSLENDEVCQYTTEEEGHGKAGDALWNRTFLCTEQSAVEHDCNIFDRWIFTFKVWIFERWTLYFPILIPLPLPPKSEGENVLHIKCTCTGPKKYYIFKKKKEKKKRLLQVTI